MCEFEFLAGFIFGFRPQKSESGFGFKKKWVDSDSNLVLDLCFQSLINSLYCHLGPPVTSCIGIQIRADWIRIQENRGWFGFVWIRIWGVWIRIRIQDVRIRTSLISAGCAPVFCPFLCVLPFSGNTDLLRSPTGRGVPLYGLVQRVFLINGMRWIVLWMLVFSQFMSLTVRVLGPCGLF